MCKKLTLLISALMLGFATGGTWAAPSAPAWSPNPAEGAGVVGPTLALSVTSDDYLKMNPPPDVDKSAHHLRPWPGSCWLATASNMLAGAGYGSGTTVQRRADEIYGEMFAHFGSGGGWTDTALHWWLSSPHNVWRTTNPYTVVTVYGHKTPKIPWANPNGARYIGNELRRCQMVGLSISWPRTWPFGSAYGGHAITGWGDELGNAVLTNNPATVRLTDSDDSDRIGDVHSYTYDSYTNPNPGGFDEGHGWYINYSPNHPFIKHIVTLCPAQWGTTWPGHAQRVVGSKKIWQFGPGKYATDLHYRVVTDVPILSYQTSLDIPTFTSPRIVERDSRHQLVVDWDLSRSSVPFGTSVIITTEVVLGSWNGLEYKDVRFSYPLLGPVRVPDLAWQIVTPKVADANSPNITGGYVVGSFDVVDPSGPTVVAQYRLLHEYNFEQDPEQHEFTLSADPNLAKSFQVSNVRFGHSYGYLDPTSLWEFQDWKTVVPQAQPLKAGAPIRLSVDWKGQLPYPQGENYRGEANVPPIRMASYPFPQDQMTDAPLHPVLSWVPGQDTGGHDVYFGTNRDSVIAASRIAPLGVLVSQGQKADTYDPGVLVPETVYCWRIDEVGADGAIYKGLVWQFRTEGAIYVVKPLEATASSFVAPFGPEKTIDGSGLNASGQHSTTDTDMWLTHMKLPQWIQYEFATPYKLDHMCVWNYNWVFEPVIGYGAKDVTIEYSADGVTWTKLSTVQFARATGLPTYVCNTNVAFGVAAKFVRLTVNTNWGGIVNGCGLSEVKFFAQH